MITGFSYDTTTGEWLVDYWTVCKGINKGSFKPLYKNNLGYFIKVGRKEIYLSDEQIKQFKEQRKNNRLDIGREDALD
jgi:hypothetical protein